jgi:hypothetical protein
VPACRATGPLLAAVLCLALLLSPGFAAASDGHALTRHIAVAAGRRGEVTLHPRARLRLARLHVSGLPPAVRLAVARGRRDAVRLLLQTSGATPAGSYVLHVTALRRGGSRFRTRVLVSVRAPRGAAALAAGAATGPGATTGPGPGATTGPGTGATTGGPGATTGPVADHVPTWAYDDAVDQQWCNGGAGASAQLVRAWLSYAESSCGPLATKALSDCHAGGVSYCTAIQYLDASRIYATGSVPIAAVAQESWWLHQPGYSDAQHRLTLSGYGGGYVLDQASSAVQGWMRSYVDSAYDGFDGLMLDDMGAGAQAWLWGTGFDSSQELGSDAQVNAAHEQLAAALAHSSGAPFLEVDNGISPNPWTEMPFMLLDHPASMRGLVSEGVPEDDGQLTPYYPTMLDEIAYVDHTADDFIVLLSYGSDGSDRARRVQAATVLLGYSAGHLVSWSDLERDSNDLAVWPEEGLVPAQPLETMAPPGGRGCLAGEGVICSRAGHNDLEVAPGVYRREFGDCYEQGSSFGPCAVLVNTTDQPVTVRRSWLRQPYGHEITLSGGDVQSGGTVDLRGASFAAGSSTVAAQDALLLGP